MEPEECTGNVEYALHRNQGNPELARRFKDVVRRVPGVAYILNRFPGADETLYFFKMYARMLSAEPRFTELLNVVGPPKSV